MGWKPLGGRGDNSLDPAAWLPEACSPTQGPTSAVSSPPDAYSGRGARAAPLGGDRSCAWAERGHARRTARPLPHRQDPTVPTRATPCHPMRTYPVALLLRSPFVVIRRGSLSERP
jgi:hypothetical protein